MAAEQKELVEGVIHLKGATCTSCAIGITHMGKRLEGVEDIYVERKDNTVRLSYDGNRGTLDRICEFVRSIGYEARYEVSENPVTPLK